MWVIYICNVTLMSNIYICQILEGLYQSTDYIDVGCSPIFDQALSRLANQIVAHIILIACK